MSSYFEKLKDPRWQKKRLEVFDRDGWECVICDSKETTLHAHHIYYEFDKNPWEYPDYALMTLCSECHEAEHEAAKFAILSLRQAMAKAKIRTAVEISYLESIIRNHFKNGVFNG